MGLYPSMYFECSTFNYPLNPANAPVVIFCRRRQSFEDQSVYVCFAAGGLLLGRMFHVSFGISHLQHQTEHLCPFWVIFTQFRNQHCPQITPQLWGCRKLQEFNLTKLTVFTGFVFSAFILLLFCLCSLFSCNLASFRDFISPYSVYILVSVLYCCGFNTVTSIQQQYY